MVAKIINPFRYLPLRQAICWGVAALILTSVFFWQMGLRLTSLTQLNYAGDRLWAATSRQVVVWLLFSVVLYLLSLLASPSKVRFVDVASFNLFARIPFDLSCLIYSIPMVRSLVGLVSEGSLETAMEYSGALTLIGLVSVLFFVWYIYWSYKAFAESANMKNARGVGVFILAFVISYVSSGYLLPHIG